MMNAQAHTPGPWTIRVATATVPTIHVISPRGQFASVQGARHVQDARLIAAAPEMLTSERDNLIALENLLSYLRKHEAELPPFSTSSLEVRIAKTRAAIAKAEGR